MASLIGLRFPDIALPSTSGAQVNLSRLQGRVVVFFYPYTGRPGYADPPGWDDIPGAHGSTPQALAFSRAYDEFETLSVKLFGVSFQDTAWQQDFVSRNALAFPLLSDADRELANALALDTFRAGPQDYLRRRTVLLGDGAVIHDITHVPDPAENAAEMLRVVKG